MPANQPTKPYAFYSTHKAVLDWWAEWEESKKLHEEMLALVAPEVAPYEGAEPAIIGAFGRWRFEGFMRDWNSDIPDGWKKSGRDGQWITPKASTKAGKALIARMAEVPPFMDPRRNKGGIPGTKLDIHFGQLPAISVHNGEGWMHFGDDWDNLDVIDLTIWSIRRMSEYYAAREARIEAKK
jgi:hypothetical protein